MEFVNRNGKKVIKTAAFIGKNRRNGAKSEAISPFIVDFIAHLLYNTFEFSFGRGYVTRSIS